MFILALTTALTVTSLPAAALAVPGPGMSREQNRLELPALPETEQVAQDNAAQTDMTTEQVGEVTSYAPAAVEPWQQDTGTVDLTDVAPGGTKPVDDLPVALGVPEAGDPLTLAGTWTVDLAAPEASQTAGVAGLIMKVTPPATADPAAEVALTIDYTAFADLYGPQAADRFGVVLLPGCVYDAPDSGDCADGTDPGTAEPVPSEVTLVPGPTGVAADARRLVTGTVSVAALGESGVPTAGVTTTSGGGRVVGVLDTGASAAGDFTATPLLSSGSWAAGSSSGAFTYSYQVQVPETAGGLMPKVALGYSSQSVDGRTSATNNQASWIGDGWDYSAGAITRSYANCRQDATAGANNTQHRTADLCWGSQNATLSLGGMTTELVYENGTWTTANGDGSRIELKSGAANRDEDGHHWIVTTRDGTKYHFGLNRLPGWSDNGSAADDPVTDSVLTVPVYGNHPGEPCYKADNWAGSACTRAWRWNLDYVEDVHGNAMSLWWNRETNHYARNFNFKAPVPYDRAGYLTRIDYGQRRDSVYSAAPLARVTFDVAERCFTEGTVTCTEANFTSQDPANYRIWYDTPADLRCADQQKCWTASPSFFSRKRLTTITTWSQRQSGSTALQKVDEHQLKQSFPTLRTGPNTALWLESVTRSGYGVSGDRITLNAVRFAANDEDMPNRVRNDNRPGFSRLRIGRVVNEYGGETVVTYKNPEGACATGEGLPRDPTDTAALRDNTRLCYPAFWHPDPGKEAIDWFHKYVVASVEEVPAVDGPFNVRTLYDYGTPGWKLAEQEFTKKSTRTYSQFAGFDQVAVRTGENEDATGSRQTMTVTRYFRGMGDTVPVRDITGSEIAKDAEPFAGRIAEELTYAESQPGADAAYLEANWLTRSVTYPEAELLATRERGTGLSPLRAWRVTDAKQAAYSRSSAGNPREVRTETDYDDTHGLPVEIESFGDVAEAGDDSCTRIEYLHHPGKHLIGLTKQVLTSPTSCAAATFDNLGTLSSAGRVAYDDKAYGAALHDTNSTNDGEERGRVRETWSLKADGSGFQSDGTTAIDGIGRVTSRTDPDGKTSTIAYLPATGQAFTVKERNSLGHEQVRELDPGRAVTLRTTDPNGRVSHAEYDALGRLVEAWGPGRTPAVTAVPDFRAEYATPEGKPPYVTTFSRGHEDRAQTSVTIYDGLGRERQTQEQAPGGGRLITDRFYNQSGEVFETYNAYHADGGPRGELFVPLARTAVPNITRYSYDGLGRVTRELPILRDQERPERATSYTYGVDQSSVINPAGSPSYRMFSDALGRTTRVDTFTDAARTEFTSMHYGYDNQGRLVQAHHSAAATHAWTWSYDQRGRLTSSTDPDTGTTRFTYDHRDRQLTTTNARNVTVWNGYDELSRPTQQRLGDGNGALLAQYTYDTVAQGKGLPATATRYTDGLAYTQSIGGYTDDYQPTSTTLTLPQSVADTWGLSSSYRYDYTFTDTGMPESSTLPAVGNLPTEKVLVRYTADGLPLSVSGKDWYGAETVYSPYGQVLRSTLGAQPYRVWTTATYDDASGALVEQQVHREQKDETAGRYNDSNLVSRRGYSYDDAGNVTAIRERAADIAERQCFRYDALGQLTTAWTSADQESCATGPLGALAVSAGTDGTGYWQEYTYDLLGNRKSLVEQDLSGRTANGAITTSYEYTGSQPRTLTSVKRAWTTPEGVEINAEARRLYELTGETRSVQSATNGDEQTLTWTYDGKVERITGQGSKGRTAYVGPGDKCLDLDQGLAKADQPVQLYPCNGTTAQKWTFVPVPGNDQENPNLGTLVGPDGWCLQPQANTAGSPLRLQACDRSAAQHLTRASTGQLTHVASGLCLAVRDGATADMTPVVLATCDGNSSAQRWEAQSETRHVYGPGGSRLLTVQGRQATLHLGESQVTVARGGALVSAQRTYPTPGGAVVRHSSNGNLPGLVAVAGDHQGSPYVEVGLAAGMPVRIRKQDPFGNQRGAADLGANMQTNAGFLGATRDDASGFVPLGARLYDPSVGRFLSADPILDLTDPQQNNGYAYAHNNPVTHSDPTGLSVSLTASEMAAALAGAGLSSAQVAQAQANMGRSLMSVILDSAWYILKEFIGINDALGCFGGDMWSCGSLLLNAIPWGKIAKIPAVLRAVDRTIAAVQAWQAAKRAAEAVLAAARAAEQAALNAKKLAIERAKKAAQAAKKKPVDKVNTTSNAAAQSAKKTGNPAQKQAQAKANPKASSAAAAGAGGKKSSSGGSKSGGSSGGSARSNGGSSGGGAGDSCTRPSSFVPGTRVLMADGSSKPIEKVKPGDKVKVTDPQTGRVEVETVTAAVKSQGVKNLVTITVDTDGDEGTATGELVATEAHPFWVPELDEWVHATDMRSGQWLRTSAGTLVQITAIERRHVLQARVHNLTVANTHTYYVVAGKTPVLVHNCGEDALQNYADSLRPGATKKGPHVAAEYTSPSGNTYYGHNGHGLSPQPGGALERALMDSGHHGGCAEVMCLIQAEAAEGAAGIVGGSMRAVRVRGLNSQGSAHGTPISPCPNACQPLLNILRIRAE